MHRNPNKGIEFNFGKDYLKHELNKFVPKGKQYISLDKIKAPDIFEKNIYLYSKKNRTGKTSYLSMLYREIINRYGYGHCKVFSDSELQSECRRSWLENDCKWLIDYYKNTTFFIFKDFAKANMDDDRVQPYLFDFMDHLFSNSPPKIMWFASNFNPRDLSNLKGRNWLDIATRIDEKCKIIEVEGR